MGRQFLSLQLCTGGTYNHSGIHRLKWHQTFYPIHLWHTFGRLWSKGGYFVQCSKRDCCVVHDVVLTTSPSLKYKLYFSSSLCFSGWLYGFSDTLVVPAIVVGIVQMIAGIVAIILYIQMKRGNKSNKVQQDEILTRLKCLWVTQLVVEEL